MNGAYLNPFPQMFFCDRLNHTVTRAGCVLRQQKAGCADCAVGGIQRQILRMEGEEEMQNNGNW